MALEIQSSVNQMISSAGVLTGLYAHQPNVQKEKEAKQKLKEIKTEQKQIGEEKEALKGVMKEELGQFVKISEDLKRKGVDEKEIRDFKGLALELPSTKELNKLMFRDIALAEQEEQYNPKLRIQRMVERSNDAKTLTLKALKEYQKGKIDLEQFKEKIGVKEPKSKKGGSK